MIVSTISSELQIFLQPNLIGWYIIISWSAVCKNLIVVVKVKITVKVQNFGGLSCEKIGLLCCGPAPGYRKRFRIPVTVHLDDISYAADPSVTKVWMVMHHHGPVSCKKIGLPSSRSRPQRGLI